MIWSKLILISLKYFFESEMCVNATLEYLGKISQYIPIKLMFC